MKELIADLSDYGIKAYINRGYGLDESGVTHSMSGIEFETYFDQDIYPMYAVDFSEYLEEQGINIEDVSSFDIVLIAYDEDGNEIDFSSEYEKFAFVSEDALDGFSDSDILPTENYKQFGSQKKTVFDLTTYTGYKADEISMSDSELADGVGMNIQMVNGEVKKIYNMMITSLVFHVED